jgi:hypothetical protein
MTDLIREADRLEELARRPLQPRRDLLLELAARLRALQSAVDRERELRFDLRRAA